MSNFSQNVYCKQSNKKTNYLCKEVQIYSKYAYTFSMFLRMLPEVKHETSQLPVLEGLHSAFITEMYILQPKNAKYFSM